jgi:hypothetical protein
LSHRQSDAENKTKSCPGQHNAALYKISSHALTKNDTRAASGNEQIELDPQSKNTMQYRREPQLMV